MSTLFISHSSSDNAAAKELSRRLAEPPRNHHSVFLDLDPEQGIVAGQSWEQTLYRKLRACRAVLALITDPYLGSQWCFAEIALARMEGKHIFALLVDPLSDGAKLPGILTEKQFIDLREDPEEAYQRLWRGLEELDLLGEANEWDPKKPPYLGLNAYGEEHAPVFFGRDDEIRAGIELLDRGAPGLIMVLGASGSGKSSMVRAGMVPRLRRDLDRWLIVGPFRPRRDPFAELAEALVQAYQRYAPDEARSSETRERLRAVRALGTGTRPGSAPGVDRQAGDGETGGLLEADERLPLLLKQLEELRRRPPKAGGSPLLDFLDWSLDDLQRICGEGPDEPPVARQRGERAAGRTRIVEIADHLRRTCGHQDARVLLVIDQFEELLGHDDAGDDTNRFLDLVRHAFEAERTPIMALGTMRSDFLGVFQRNRALLGVDFESLSVGPMHVDGMRRVIEEPARLAAVGLEQGLADRLLADTETPDALPLLSFTMSVLWKARQGGTMSVRQYEELDGLHGAVAREAQAVLDSARRQGKEEDVRKAFLQMARLTEDGTYARKPVTWDRPEIREVRPILEEFEKRRLLVTRMEKGEERTVEVAHEALFRSWPPLKTWLDDHRAVLMLRAQLRRDAQAWEENDRAVDRLWHGGRLQQAEDIMRKGELGGADADGGKEVQFVRAGVQRRQRRRGMLAGITALAFAVLAGFLWNAVVLKRAATAERDRTLRLQSQFLADAAVQELRKGDAITGALLALEGLKDPKSADKIQRIRPYVSEAYLSLESVWRCRREQAVLSDHLDSVWSAAFNPQGDLLVTTSGDRTAKVWNLQTRQVIKTLGHKDNVRSAAFSHDGRWVVTASQDKTAQVWDPRSGSKVGPAYEHDEVVYAAAFSHDGNSIVTAADNIVRIWNAHSRDSPPQTLEHKRSVFSAAFSRDDAKVVTASGDNLARVWHVESGRLLAELKGHGGSVHTAEFNKEGDRIVTASADNTARIWKATGSQIESLRHDGEVMRAVYSPNGDRIVTVSRDRTARIWDAATGEEIERLTGHQGEVHAAAFSPDGLRLVTASRDRTARLWGDSATNEVRSLIGHDGEIWSAVVSPDGNRIVTASEDNTARLWDATTGLEIPPAFKGHKSAVNFAVYRSDGNRVVTASNDKTARIWSVKARTELHSLPHPEYVSTAVFSPNGDFVVTTSNQQTTRIWDATTGDLVDIDKEANPGDLTFAVYDPGGTQILRAVGSVARVSKGLKGEVTTRTLPPGHESWLWTAVFSAKGDLILTASDDGTARIWDSTTGKQIHILEGHERALWSASFSPDGRRIVTASKDMTARLWDTRTGETVKILRGHAGEVHGATFSPDGERVVTASADRTARIWDTAVPEPQELIDQIKEETPRCLTPAQRAQFFLAPDPPSWCIELEKWPYQATR